MPAAETQQLTPQEEALVEELLVELRRCYNHRGGAATVSLTVRVGKGGILSREVQATRRTETTEREPG